MAEPMGLLDPRLQQYMQQQRQQQFWGQIARMGQGILQASMGGADFGPALASGLGQGGGGQQPLGLLDMMPIQGLLDDQKYRTQQTEAQQKYGLGLAPDQQALFQANPPGYIKSAQAAEFAKKPQGQFETVQDPYGRGGVGQRSTLSGKISEYQGPATKYGPSKFDTNTGKWYQEDQSGKRHYTSQQTGMEITTPEGLTIRTGVQTGGAGGMQKKTRGDIEKKLMGAREGLARLRGIESKYRPEYQEIPTRLGVAWTGLKAKLGMGENISPEDRQLATEYADYNRAATENINLYIKEITGAQMSEPEADRLKLAVADPGAGIFGGDDPIKFESKLRASIQGLEKAAARYEYYLNKGITDIKVMARQMPLDAMQTATNEQTGERLIEIAGQWIPIQ